MRIKSNENKIQEIRQPQTITVYKAVTNQALISYTPNEKTNIIKEIEKNVAKLFYALGHTIEVKRIEIITELLIESRRYETPETIFKIQTRLQFKRIHKMSDKISGQ
mgnify:CR=1 FL=1